MLERIVVGNDRKKNAITLLCTCCFICRCGGIFDFGIISEKKLFLSFEIFIRFLPIIDILMFDNEWFSYLIIALEDIIGRFGDCFQKTGKSFASVFSSNTQLKYRKNSSNWMKTCFGLHLLCIRGIYENWHHCERLDERQDVEEILRALKQSF